MQTSRSDSIRTIVAADLPQRDDWHVNCLSSVREMALVIETVVAAMTGLGYPPKDIFGTRLALEEAICNAIKHGHQHDPTNVVEVRYCIQVDHFLLEVEDQGPGFDPALVTTPPGCATTARGTASRCASARPSLCRHSWRQKLF